MHMRNMVKERIKVLQNGGMIKHNFEDSTIKVPFQMDKIDSEFY